MHILRLSELPHENNEQKRHQGIVSINDVPSTDLAAACCAACGTLPRELDLSELNIRTACYYFLIYE